MDLTGKVVVVTGGGNGIGREVVLALLARGARVAAVDLDETGLKATADLAGADAGLSLHPVDITDRAAVLALPAEVVATHGQVDGLVNVAGVIQHFVPVADLDFAEIERVMAVNFWGTVTTTKAFLPLLLERPAAGVVNVSSMGGLVPVPGQSAYGASKAAVKLFSEALYAELHDTTVAVSTVFPGGVDTDILGNSGVEMDIAADPSSYQLTSAAEAGRQIVAALEQGRARVLIGSDARMLDRLGRLTPRRAILLVARKMKDLTG